MYVYLAGGIKGLTYEEATRWRGIASCMLSDASNGKITCLDPLRFQEFRDKGSEEIDSHDNAVALSSSRFLTDQDRFDVARADLILANFLPSREISIGTVMEIAWADAHRKPVIIAAREDDPHWVHPMLRQCVTHRFGTIEEAAEAAWQFLLP